MLAGEVADLTGGWAGGIARRGFAADERVEVRESACTVARRRDGEGVDVVDCLGVISGFVHVRDGQGYWEESLLKGPYRASLGNP